MYEMHERDGITSYGRFNLTRLLETMENYWRQDYASSIQFHQTCLLFCRWKHVTFSESYAECKGGNVLKPRQLYFPQLDSQTCGCEDRWIQLTGTLEIWLFAYSVLTAKEFLFIFILQSWSRMNVHFCPKVASGIIFLGLTFICGWHSYNFGSLGKTYSYLSWLRIGAIIICSPLLSISEALDGIFFWFQFVVIGAYSKNPLNNQQKVRPGSLANSPFPFQLLFALASFPPSELLLGGRCMIYYTRYIYPAF